MFPEWKRSKKKEGGNNCNWRHVGKGQNTGPSRICSTNGKDLAGEEKQQKNSETKG